KDGECDDPRFIGSAAAEAPEDVDTMHDATDCKTAFEAGTVTVKTAAVDGPTPTLADVDFGDDTGQYPKDGECDDPRFTGTAAADEPDDADIRKDATDCKAAFGAGTVTLKGDGTTAAVDFGSDTSKYAKDGECDDPRFTGPGTDKKLLAEDKMADATDCQALLNAGSVTLRAVFDPNYVAGAPYDPGTIDFGDNASSYASDGECDDPRFEGPGLADSPVAENKWHDHDDCLAAFQAGTVALAQ
ncbi:hypothetical protein, partial [Devosia sp.]|uniref:hypothetical protein n=1 Tax=Devosia sp. TaxID=1871048 RepID=UPI003265E9D8